MKKVILLFSGGRDSTLLLKIAKNLGYELHCVLFDYAQTHSQELEFAKQQCQKEQVSFDLITLSLPIQSNLLSQEQTYEGVSEYHVPSRNAIFTTIASGIAETKGYDTIWIGANYEDREDLFPDCYQEWIFQMNKLLQINGSTEIRIEAPLLGMSSKIITDISENLYNIKQKQIFSGYGK